MLTARHHLTVLVLELEADGLIILQVIAILDRHRAVVTVR